MKTKLKELRKLVRNRKVVAVALIALNVIGMVINSVTNGISNTFNHTSLPLLEINPIKNILAVFTPAGIGIIGFVVIMYCLLTRKGYALLSGYKTIMDKERNIEILPEGTHGTSNWISAKQVTTSAELVSVFDTGKIEDTQTTLLGKISIHQKWGLDTQQTYVGIRERIGMNNNVLVYGAPGTGKSQGFAKPFIFQAAERGESVILVDPKAGATRS